MRGRRPRQRHHHHDGQLARLASTTAPTAGCSRSRRTRRSSRPRAYRAWPRILDDEGLLEGKTIGIVRMDTVRAGRDGGRRTEAEPRRTSATRSRPKSVLPCPEGTQTVRAARRRDPTVAGRRRRLRVPRRADAAGFGDGRGGGEPRLRTRVDDDRQQRHRHGRAVLHEREGQLRRRLGHQHGVHRRRPRRRPSATASRSRAAPRSSRAGADGYGFTARDVPAAADARRRDRGGRRRDHAGRP